MDLIAVRDAIVGSVGQDSLRMRANKTANTFCSPCCEIRTGLLIYIGR